MADKGWRRSPTVILGALTALNGLNYLDRYVAAATLTLILADLRDLGLAGRPAPVHVHRDLCAGLSARRAGWAIAVSRMRLAAAGIFVWSLATVGSGLATTYALPDPRARRHRRRRGRLRRGDAAAAVGLLSAGATGGACSASSTRRSRWAARSATSWAAWSGEALRLAERPSSWPARRASRSPFSSCCSSSPPAAPTTPPPRGRPRRRDAFLRCCCARQELRREHRRADHLHLRHGRASPPGRPPTSCASAASRWRWPPPPSAASSWWRASWAPSSAAGSPSGWRAARPARTSCCRAGPSPPPSSSRSSPSSRRRPLVFWPAMFVMLLPALRQYRAAQRGDGERAARRAARARLRAHHHAHASPRRRDLALAHRRWPRIRVGLKLPVLVTGCLLSVCRASCS